MDSVMRRRIVILAFVALGLGAGMALITSCGDDPLSSRGRARPECWKPLPTPPFDDLLVVDYSPVWSWTGKEIAFTSLFDSCNDLIPGELFIMDEKGVCRNSLGFQAAYYQWFPHDTAIMFSTSVFVGSRLRIFHLSTGTITELPDAPIGSTMPIFGLSRDGKRVYVSDEQIRIVEYNVVDFSKRVLSSYGGGFPQPSPDGNHLSFTFGFALVILDLKNIPALDTVVDTAAYAQWTPDGKNLVYADGNGQGIWIIDLESRAKKKLAKNSTLLSVSPDGRFVLYADFASDRSSRIFQVSIDGGTPKQITR